MQRNIRRAVLVTAAALAIVSLGAGAAHSEARSSASSGDASQYFSYVSSKPLPATVTVAELKKAAQAGDVQVSFKDSSTGATTTLGAADGVTLGGESMVTPLAATPSGYYLWNPGTRVSDYVYKSDNAELGTGPCVDGKCTATEKVNYVLKETVTGGSSKTWTIRTDMTQLANDPGITFINGLTYYCGVNINNAPDRLCEGAGASDSGTTMNVNTNYVRYFESTTGGINFPMIKVDVVWSTGFHGDMKFRGWDVGVSSTSTKLKTSSGTGA